MPNLNKLKKLRETVLANDQFWSQHDWARKFPQDSAEVSCGTTYCMAGWACVNEGYKMDWTKGTEPSRQYIEEAGEYRTFVVTSFLTDGKGIEATAQEILGLDDEQATNLFFSYDKDEALEVLDNLIAEAEEA